LLGLLKWPSTIHCEAEAYVAGSVHTNRPWVGLSLFSAICNFIANFASAYRQRAVQMSGRAKAKPFRTGQSEIAAASA
jgi:hypothetical protein